MTLFGSVMVCVQGGPGPTLPTGPPCMETFVNKQCASSTAACPVSFCTGGGSGVMVGVTEWAGHPSAYQGAQSSTRKVSRGKISGIDGAVHRGIDLCSCHVALMTGTHRETSAGEGLFSHPGHNWHRAGGE